MKPRQPTSLRKAYTFRSLRWLVGKPLFSRSSRLRHFYSAPTDAVDAREICRIVVQDDADFHHFIPPQLRGYFRDRPAALGHDGDNDQISVASRFIVFELHHGSVYGHTGAVVQSESGRLVDPSLSEIHRQLTVRRSFKLRRLPTTIRINDYSIPFLDSRAGHRHYGHFLLERMQQLLLLLKTVPQSRSATLLVRADMPDYQLVAISQLLRSYPNVILRRISEDVRVECEFLLLSAFHTPHTLGWFARPRAMIEIRNLYFDAYRANLKLADGRRLYLSRNNQKLRRLGNEKEILPLLVAAGFRNFAPRRTAAL